MGVKTTLTLGEAQSLFASFNISSLTPTDSGIMDTTYLTDNFIIKKYEREVDVNAEIKLLTLLSETSLPTPKFLAQNAEWFLYERLKGTQPRVIKTYHIQALARFLAAFHTQTYKTECSRSFLESNDLTAMLRLLKSNYFFYYKKLQFLTSYRPQNDGFIHGDIFKDNTVFDKGKIGVFDFIDGGCGEFIFDMAVCLISFDAKKYSHYFINIFLNTYNQKAPKKIQKKDLIKTMEIASAFYALLRIDTYKTTSQAKELL